MDELFYNAIELLNRLISTPSISREEEAVANLLEQELVKIPNCSLQRIGNNLLLSPAAHNAALPNLLLNSHMDTVRAVEGWSRDPFTPTLEGECLYGLGSNDAGASLVSLIAAYQALIAKEQPYNLLLLASCQEEVSGADGVSLVLPYLPKIDLALVGEPTQMQPAIAEKGLMVLDCTVRGVAGHAARNEGVNAIYQALPLVEQLQGFRFPEVSPLLGETKVTVTQINAGTQHNVIPDCCHFVVDVRTNECISNGECLAQLQAALPCEVVARSTRLNSSRIDPNHRLVQRCVTLGKEPFGSPTLSDQALMPFPSLKMGPGDSARSHTADEFILCSEIRDAIECYVKLLDGLYI